MTPGGHSCENNQIILDVSTDFNSLYFQRGASNMTTVETRVASGKLHLKLTMTVFVPIRDANIWFGESLRKAIKSYKNPE